MDGNWERVFPHIGPVILSDPFLFSFEISDTSDTMVSVIKNFNKILWQHIFIILIANFSWPLH